jgi:predicted regulator of Ras-like GTPase activity (Roadblock/LC7/MglB family)
LINQLPLIANPHPSCFILYVSYGILFTTVAMSDSRSTQIVNRLRDLQASAPDIIASAVVTADGLSLASNLPSNVEEERVAAMSAAMLSLGERIAQELQRGNMEEVYIRGEEGLVLLTAIGRDAVLTTLARSEAKLGLMLLEMRRTAAELEPYVA